MRPAASRGSSPRRPSTTTGPANSTAPTATSTSCAGAERRTRGPRSLGGGVAARSRRPRPCVHGALARAPASARLPARAHVAREVAAPAPRAGRLDDRGSRRAVGPRPSARGGRDVRAGRAGTDRAHAGVDVGIDPHRQVVLVVAGGSRSSCMPSPRTAAVRTRRQWYSEKSGGWRLAGHRVGHGHVVQGHLGVDLQAAVDLDDPAGPAPGHVDTRRVGRPRRVPVQVERADGPRARVASTVCSSRASQPSLIVTSLSTNTVNWVVRNGRAATHASHGGSRRGPAAQEQEVAAGHDVVVPLADGRRRTAVDHDDPRRGAGGVEDRLDELGRGRVPLALADHDRRAGMGRRLTLRRDRLRGSGPVGARVPRCSSMAMADRTIAQMKRSTARPTTAANCCWRNS